MKAVAYNIKNYERKLLALASGKIHDLTLISNPLNHNTIHYSFGKQVIIVSEEDIVDSMLLREIKNAGIEKIVTRSFSIEHIDLHCAKDLRIEIANTTFQDRTPKGIANQTIHNLNLWEKGICVAKICRCFDDCKSPIVSQVNEEHDK